ncbi:MAG: MFS transporter [Caldilineaceae bacterium]
MKFLIRRAEGALAGSLSDDERTNMRLEVATTMIYGIFYASVLTFTPVVLRRLGASADMLAVYNSLLFLGSLLTTFSVILMRRRRTRTVLLLFWFVARSLFLLCAIFTGAEWLIVLSALYWLLEGFVIPAYSRVMQKLYSDAVRGKVMSTVRMGQVSAILVITPLAGWALDLWGHQVLFPLASLIGVFSVLVFSYIRLEEGVLPPRQTKTISDLLQIVKQDRRFDLHLLAFALLGMGTMLASPFYPIVQVDRLHLSYSQVGLLGLVESSLWLTSYLFWGRILDRFGGVYVLELVCLASMFIPASYIFASTPWLLIPAFIARGIVAAGFDLGRINAGIQLAHNGQFIEYAAIQSTVVGIRGLLAPMLGLAFLHLGVPYNGVFAISVGLMGAGWLLYRWMDVPRDSVSVRQ